MLFKSPIGRIFTCYVYAASCVLQSFPPLQAYVAVESSRSLRLAFNHVYWMFPGDFSLKRRQLIGQRSRVSTCNDHFPSSSTFSLPLSSPSSPSSLSSLSSPSPLSSSPSASVSRDSSANRRYSSQSMKGDYSKELAVALEAVYRSCFVSEKLRRSLKDTDKVLKADMTPVTIADVTVQFVVAEHLSRYFEDAAILGEEDMDSLSEEFKRYACDTLNEYLPLEENLDVLKGKTPSSSSQLIRKVDYLLKITSSACLSKKHTDLKKNSSENEDEEAYVKRRISEISAEEGGRYWVLDPIDGTKGFIRGDQYAIALALVEDGVPVMGLLGCPNLPHSLNDPNALEKRGCVFYAVKGHGARMIKLDPKFFDSPNYYLSPLGEFSSDVAISTEKVKDLSMVVMAESFEAAHSNHSTSSKIMHKLKATKQPIKMDSQVKYGLVARGDCHVMLRFPRKGYRECVWDHCAGSIIVEEAGGCVSHANGNKLQLVGVVRMNSDNPGIVVTSNEYTHSEVLKAIKEVL